MYLVDDRRRIHTVKEYIEGCQYYIFKLSIHLPQQIISLGVRQYCMSIINKDLNNRLLKNHDNKF
jgi:hypothetical protein